MKFNNTFENGINQDVTVTKQPQGTYRDLHNGMLISYDGNHYAVETALGNTVNFIIPPRYSPTGTGFALDAPPLPIGMLCFIDKLVIFSTNSSDNTPMPETVGYGEIGIVTFNDSGQGTYVPIYNDQGLNFSKYFKIHGFGYPENEKTQRVYWTDNNNEPRVLNVVDPLFIPVLSGSIIPGKQYMVVGGAITIGANTYGPGLPAGNIIPITNTNTTYIYANQLVPGINPVVTPYINPSSLSFVPNRYLGDIDFVRWLPAGTVTGGAKMYFFRLGLRQQGFFSAWSYGSSPINVSGQPSPTYKDQQGCGVISSISGRGLRIQIDNIDTLFDTIEVACASFDSKNNVLTGINAVALTTITGPVMTFDHTGSEVIAQFSQTDITTFNSSILRFKDLATTKNYLTIGNIQEREELDFDTSTISISDKTYLIPADEFGNTTNAGNFQQGQNYELVDYGLNPVGQIIPHGKFVVQGNAGDSVTYNSTVYSVGQTFEGVVGQANFTPTTTAIVLAAIVLNKYNDNLGNTIQRVIPILNDFWDYKGMATTKYLRQYWSGETYRFAIMFYDIKGNPYFARWIGDKQIQSLQTKGGLLDAATANNWSLKANGLSISGITIPPSMIGNVSGFSILRAPRDVQRYAQGIIMQTVPDNGTPSAPQAKPISANIVADDWYYFTYNHAVPNVYTYFSPDYLFNSSTLGSLNPTNQTLETVCFINPINPSLGVDKGIFTDPSWTQSGSVKYYNPITTDLTSNSIAAFVGSVGTYGGVTGIASGYDFVNGYIRCAPFGSNFASNRIAAAGNCAVIRTTAGISAPNGAHTDDISSGAFSLNPLKPLSNIYIPKTNLYGGQSADAIANTPFISTGHFQSLTDPAVLASVFDGTNYVFNNIDVFGGDSFVTIMDYCKAPFDDQHIGSASGSYNYSILFPVESNVNPSLREGNSVTKNGMLGISGTNGIYYAQGSSTNPEDFDVNDGYTSDGTPFEYPSLPVNFTNVGDFSYRVRWGNPKISGEQIDNFRIFPTNDFRDLDGRKGQINNLSERDGKLFYWQDHVVGYLPILERQMTDGDLGQAVQLGVGGVIDRFDQFNSYFGNQHQNSLIETEYGFSWFDMRRRAWLIMTVDGGVQEISMAKGMQAFFNTVFEKQYLPNNILSRDTPLVGIGVHGIYDPEFKTTFLTFKNYTPGDGEKLPYKNFDFTIGYNHTKNVIVGFFDFNPAIWQSFNRYLLSSKDTESSFNTVIEPNTNYIVGSIVYLNSAAYVCLVPFKTHNPVQPFEMPDYFGSLLWKQIYVENEIYAHWTGNICKFYGLVYPFRHDVIINPTTEEMFVVDNLQLKSSVTQNFDSITYSTDNDSAIDNNLNSGSPYYRVRDAAWESNVPLGSQGRLIDFYLKVSFVLNNVTTNPTISKNLKKVTAFINSVFRIKL